MKPQANLKSKLIQHSNIDALIDTLEEKGKSIAFTNGCFDILHLGHVIYLEEAAKLADVLILGLNSDESVRRQGKGSNRPLNSYGARATVIAGLASVDYVVEFDEDTPLALIQRIRPDVLIKGGDYDPHEEDPRSKKYIVGRDVLLDKGGKIEAIPFVEGYSTTALIKKITNDN